MNVLLIGGSNSLLNQMIKKLNKEGHRVSVLTGSRFRMEKYERVFERYDFTYDAVNLPEVFTSVSPDVTVCMGAFDSSYRWSNDQGEAVQFIAGLMNQLTAFSSLRRGRFIYLSSEIVFSGTSRVSYGADDAGDAVDYRGLAVMQGEELCESFRINRELDIVTVRLGGYYYLPRSLGQIDTVVARMCFDALTERRIHVRPEMTISLLHESDAVQFLYQLITAPDHARSRYQITSGRELTQAELAEMVRDAFRDAQPGSREQEILILEEKNGAPGCTALDNSSFRDEFGVNRVRDVRGSIDEIVRHMVRNEKIFRQDLDEAVPWYQRLRKKLGGALSAILPFVENLVLFVPFFLLSSRAADSAYFSKVDFFLLYVLLFAVVHGQQQATVSAILATAGFLFRQIRLQSGFDVLVDYNTYIWVAQIFAIGLIVGYMKDQIRLQRSEAKEEHSYLSEQIDDIKEINSSNVRVKDAMQTQIINQSDSIGKIYEITSTLNQYSFEEVLFYATEILGSIMDSRDVAIYTVDNSAYARLFTATSPAARALGNSVKYRELPGLNEEIAAHRVYINKELDPALPMMASALYEGDEVRMLLMVWNLPWEKMTLGQANLLAVTGALIQNAALRASRYLEALRSERFIGETPILNEKEFHELVDAYFSARSRGLTEFSLLRLDMAVPETVAAADPAEAPLSKKEKKKAKEKEKEKEEKEKEKKKKKNKDKGDAEKTPRAPEPAAPDVTLGEAQTLSRQIRPHDYLGEGTDGKMYVLLTNTDAAGAEIVINRMNRSGVRCRSVERLP